jgi:hypothetical protein
VSLAAGDLEQKITPLNPQFQFDPQAAGTHTQGCGRRVSGFGCAWLIVKIPFIIHSDATPWFARSSL